MEEENITFRRRKTDLNILSTSLEDNSFLSTNSNALGRSLPDLSTFNCQEITELQNTIRDLKEKLESAHMEIENLILEKSALQMTLQNQETKLQNLTKICSPLISTPKKKPGNMQLEQEPKIPSKINNTYNSSQKCLSTKIPKLNTVKQMSVEKVNNRRSTRHTTQYNDKKTTTTNTPVCSIKNDYPNGKIHILGTQQIRGLTKRLYELRLNSPYNKYSVEGTTKYYATSKQLLNTEFKYKPCDKIIICIGENDYNPTTMLNDLYMFTNKYNNCPIIVLSVIKNKYLNEKLLNNNLELICKNNKNCYFLRTHSNTCHKLNVLIDSIDYKDKYLNFNKPALSRCADLPSYYNTNLGTRQGYRTLHSNNYNKMKNNCFRY